MKTLVILSFVVGICLFLVTGHSECLLLSATSLVAFAAKFELFFPEMSKKLKNDDL